MSTVAPNFRCTVLVGNIPSDTSEEQLKDIFAQIGPVVNFRLLYEKESGKPKGYGICEYRDKEMALSAVRNLNGYEIKGKILRVDICTSERSKEELKNLQISPAKASGEGSHDPETQTEKAPEAISKAVASLPPEQMFELMKQMKMCIQNNPSEARNLLLQNPQLAYALLQAQVVMRIVDPQVAMNILNRPSPPNAPSSSTSKTESEAVKTVAPTSSATTKVPMSTASAFPPSISNSHVDSSTSNVPTSVTSSVAVTTSPSVTSAPHANTLVNETPRSSVPPPHSSQLGDGPVLPMAAEVSRSSIPPPRHLPQRSIDAFGPFGDPRTVVDRDMRMASRVDLGNPRLSSRVDQDMRHLPTVGLGDQDMRQPMGDQDFRVLRDLPVMENRPYDPRIRSMAGGDTSGRMVPLTAPYDPRSSHPFDPRTAHEARPSVPLTRLEDPRTAALAAMRSQASSRTTTTSAASALAQSLPSVGNSRPSSSIIAAANAIAPHDQEKAALIMQVLQLSDEQIAMLPPGQRQSILILKEQIARSCPP